MFGHPVAVEGKDLHYIAILLTVWAVAWAIDKVIEYNLS